MTNPSNSDPLHYVAIDVAKDTLQIQDDHCRFHMRMDRVKNRPPLTLTSDEI